MNGAKAILLGALLGGMMSVDMGGPVNKAAYVFGTASIAAGNYNIMAAVIKDSACTSSGRSPQLRLARLLLL